MPDEERFRCRNLKDVFLGEPERRAGVQVVGLEIFEEAVVLRWDVDGDGGTDFAPGLADGEGHHYTPSVASRENDLFHEGRTRGRMVFGSPSGHAARRFTAICGEFSVPLLASTPSVPVRRHSSLIITRPLEGRLLGVSPTIVEIHEDSACVHWHFLGMSREPPQLALSFGQQRRPQREEQKAWLRVEDALIGSSQFVLPRDHFDDGAELLVGGSGESLQLW
jgi:hypothetical protein